ncbi:MAG: histidine phosphatase family protein [Pseudomonadota bacterium]|nr:histidine phosphatase family protein [Pseudomonadota bacterium]
MRQPPTCAPASRRLAVWLAALATAALIAETSHGTAFADTEAPAGPPLLTALKTGGLILYFRHASTDFGQNDEQMTGFEDCGHQRNLTDKGRDEARAIGATIARLALPVGDVLASPFCRTMETAKLIFGRAAATPAVRGGPASGVAPDRYAELKKLLSTPPRAGTDLVIVSHGNPFRAVSDAPYLAEGEAAVIRPLGAAGFRIVARLPKDGWDSLGAP